MSDLWGLLVTIIYIATPSIFFLLTCFVRFVATLSTELPSSSLDPVAYRTLSISDTVGRATIKGTETTSLGISDKDQNGNPLVVLWFWHDSNLSLSCLLCCSALNIAGGHPNGSGLHMCPPVVLFPNQVIRFLHRQEPPWSHMGPDHRNS